MLTLINTNQMRPPIAPIGLDYVATAARRAGVEVDLLDLCQAEDPAEALQAHFAARSPELVGLTFRNVDDCFWPSAESFVPELTRTVSAIHELSGAPVVLGGVGYSMFPQRLVEETGADFGIAGDGEEALAELAGELRGRRRFGRVPGLLWRADGRVVGNPPAWPTELRVPTSRDAVDNAAYFRLGGQVGLETKRGCDRPCIFCADPLAKGPRVRPRSPADVAEEAGNLLAQGADVLHLCDSEFNIPGEHARAVCEEFIRCGLGERIRWYAYLAVTPFDGELAAAMGRAGCVGINFTADSANAGMLGRYRHRHGKADLSEARRLCRENGMAVMFDLLLGGPGETPESVGETIDFFRALDPEAVGASLGVRLYPGTGLTELLKSEGPIERLAGLRRRYDGPVDLLRPTFYISPALGKRPAALVRELIGGDARFFEPVDECPAGHAEGDHNYNDNGPLVAAIAAGARGAYWDILRRLRR